MAELTIIVAFDAQYGIGINNTLAWHIPEDLIRFKQITTGHAIIMGRKTYDSIGKPLPNRRSIVLTRQTDWHPPGVEVVHTLSDAIGLLGDEEAFVIGGAEIYAQALPLCSKLLVTEIHHDVRCDAFFPAFDKTIWKETERDTRHSAKNGFDFSFVTYQKA
jgi:dihydrofolate reductase